MRMIELTRALLPRARALLRENYEEERRAVPALPAVERLPDLEIFAEDGLGVAAFEGDRLLGFLGALPAFDEPWGIPGLRGVFSPLHGHGAAAEGRGEIYSRLYQAAAEKWLRAGAASHGISLFAHDVPAQESFVLNGFGMRCMDAVRELSAPAAPVEGVGGCGFVELPPFGRGGPLPGGDWEQVAALAGGLVEHESSSPFFLWNPPMTRERFRAEAEEGGRYFAAKSGARCAAYLQVVPGGAETFVSEEPGMPNIKGAYCLPEYRGTGVYAGLLAHVCGVLYGEGYTHLGVDFESVNPAGRGFWRKHFSAYTHGYVRRVDETMLGKVNGRGPVPWEGGTCANCGHGA